MTGDAQHLQNHPAPQRERASVAWLLGALAAGPAAWSAQLIVGYGLSSHACFPRTIPLFTAGGPAWRTEGAVLLAINIACLLLALAGAMISALLWRLTKMEKPANAHRTLEIGEGRTRFIALCGLLAGAGFALAILFDTPVILAVPTCWSILQ